MNKATLATFGAIGLTLILVASATAQSSYLHVDIPFNFNVGEQELSSGKYTVRILAHGGALIIQSEDSKKAAVSLSNSMYPPRNLRGGQLVFNLYGTQYFLSSVSWPEG